MDRLQGLALFGSGCGGAGPAESRQCISLTLGPCLQMPLPSSASPLWPGCSRPTCKEGPSAHFAAGEGEAPGEREDWAVIPVEVQAGGLAGPLPGVLDVNTSQSPDNPLHPQQ